LFAQIYPTLPPNIQAGITSVTYFSPGNPKSEKLPLLQLDSHGVASNFVTGDSPLDGVVTSSDSNTPVPGTILRDCGHDANCEFGHFLSIPSVQSATSNGCPTEQVFTPQNPNGTPRAGGGGGKGGFGGGLLGGGNGTNQYYGTGGGQGHWECTGHTIMGETTMTCKYVYPD
jgi:hypothetical protein